MELEVGMYARTNKGRIGRITGISERYVEMEWNNRWKDQYYKENIVKTSHNIKELLQVGDIITYEFPTGLGMLKYENVTILEDLLDVLKSIDEYEILSIVTKEQFLQMEYKVGE